MVSPDLLDKEDQLDAKVLTGQQDHLDPPVHPLVYQDLLEDLDLMEPLGQEV